LLTGVCTTLSTIPDDAVVESVHQTLSEKSLLPEEHLVDTGYVTAAPIIDSQADYRVDLIGRVRINSSWQTQNNSKFSAEQFEVDWEHQVVTCPKGHQSIIW